MDQDLKRISDELRLPPESRERIRARLASCQDPKEEVSVKKSVLKTRIPLIAAAVIMAMALLLTAGAVAVQFFRNDIIVDSWEDIPDPADEGIGAVGVTGPIGNPPSTLEEMIEDSRFKSDGWSSKETIGGGGLVYGYNQWDDFKLIDNDPALRSRRVTRADGAEKLEYTAENPASLVDTLTGRVTCDLSWMGEHYDYVPDGNFSYVVTDPEGGYVCELLDALYAKPDGSGYVTITLSNTVTSEDNTPTYVIDGSYETAYYYTSSGGYEFLIEMNNGTIWASCKMSCADVSLYGAYLTQGEIEDILDNLQLSIEG